MGNAFNPYEAPRAEGEPLVASFDFLNQASLGVRFANVFIDNICRVLIGSGVGALLGQLSDPGIGAVFTVLWLFGYYIFFEGLFQVTPGKLITRTRVVDLNGNKPTFLQIVGRSFARFVPFEPFSFFGSTADGWHDRWSGTRVVRR